MSQQTRTSVSSMNNIYLEGFLVKQGHVRHNWKTRWFKLSDSSLRYYKTQKHNAPQGRIPLKNATLIINFNDEETNTKREHVFKVISENGSEYPIQAASLSEFQIWTDGIQEVIDRLAIDRTLDVEDSVFKSTTLPNTNDVNDNNEVHHLAETIIRMSKNDSGIQREAREVDGIRYTQGFSGISLQKWMFTYMGLSGIEAVSTVNNLLQTGMLDCLTSDTLENPFFDQHYYRLLTDDMSRGTGQRNTSITSSMEIINVNKSEKFKIRTLSSSRDNSGLPKDLPEGTVVKRGILFKRGHVIPSWKARMFVLQGQPASLSYYDPTKKNAKTINTLSLHGASVFSVGKIAAQVALAIKDPPEHLFCVKISSGTLYLIIATCDEERDEWIKAIKPVCKQGKKLG